MHSAGYQKRKASKGTVKVKNSNGRLQLVFNFGGKRHYLSLGLADTKVNRKAAETKAGQIELDIASGNFDLILQSTIDKLFPDSVLCIYVRGRYKAIETLGQKIRYYTSTNVPTQLLGNVINSAYVAHTL